MSDHGISLEKKFLHSFKEHVRGFHISNIILLVEADRIELSLY